MKRFSSVLWFGVLLMVAIGQDSRVGPVEQPPGKPPQAKLWVAALLAMLVAGVLFVAGLLLVPQTLQWPLYKFYAGVGAGSLVVGAVIQFSATAEDLPARSKSYVTLAGWVVVLWGASFSLAGVLAS